MDGLPLGFGCCRKREEPSLDTLLPRDNRLLSTGLNLDIFILSSLNGRVFAAYGDLVSSLGMESYREIQAGAALSWAPASRETQTHS